jgi:hypothetical protein
MLKDACHWPTTDTGHPCTDDAQCQGLCMPTDDAYHPAECTQGTAADICSTRRVLLLRDGDPTTGVCASERRNAMPANCKTHIVNGRLVTEGCAD